MVGTSFVDLTRELAKVEQQANVDYFTTLNARDRELHYQLATALADEDGWDHERWPKGDRPEQLAEYLTRPQGFGGTQLLHWVREEGEIQFRDHGPKPVPPGCWAAYVIENDNETHATTLSLIIIRPWSADGQNFVSREQVTFSRPLSGDWNLPD